MTSLLILLLACQGADPDGSATNDPAPTGPTATDDNPTPTYDTDIDIDIEPPARLERDIPLTEVPMQFTGANAACEAGELETVAEVLGGAERIWVESYRDQNLVETIDLDIRDADLEVFQEASGSTQNADCDVDAWVWRAERGTSGACYVTGPEARDIARYLGCLSE